MHRDVIVTIVDDLVNRRLSEQITSAQFEAEAVPMLTAYMKASNETLRAEMDELRANISSMPVLIDSYRRDQRDFNEFLLLKGLEKEFDSWLLLRMEKEEEEGG